MYIDQLAEAAPYVSYYLLHVSLIISQTCHKVEPPAWEDVSVLSAAEKYPAYPGLCAVKAERGEAAEGVTSSVAAAMLVCLSQLVQFQ